MTSIIQLNEYHYVAMVKEQEMRYAMTTILNLEMDAIQIDRKLRIHGYALEETRQQKTCDNTVILALDGIEIMKLYLSYEYQDEMIVRE